MPASNRGLLRTIRLGRKQQKGTPLLPYQQLRYWSTVPYRHGDRDAIKYSAIPGDNPARSLQPGPNRLQDELVRHVNEDERMSEFTFSLQFLEPERMTYKGTRQEPSFWVENAAIEWKESESPFHPVGRLRLLPKSVLTPAEAEAFSIDVTEHSTPETRPIGSINRARWSAEAASREVRCPLHLRRKDGYFARSRMTTPARLALALHEIPLSATVATRVSGEGRVACPTWRFQPCVRGTSPLPPLLP